MRTPQLDHIVDARWFQGKGLPVRQIGWTPLPWYVADGDIWVRSELAVLDVGGQAETYHLLVGYTAPGKGEPEALAGQTDLPGRGLVDVVDAAYSPTAMAAFLRAVTAPGQVAVTWLGDAPGNLATKVFSGEQSNTTVQIGDDVLFKIFRHVSPGENLEATTLAAMASSQITPKLIGTLQAGSDYDLGIFVERILDAHDGWEYCVDRCKTGQFIGSDMVLLGQSLRRLHTGLAAAFGTSEIDAADVGRQLLKNLDAESAQLPELAALEAPLREILTLPSMPIEVQRIHGDFHLGQCLISPHGWTIIDFEGEPLKTPTERAAPDSVWRDVAGLLRSLDYVRRGHGASENWYEDARAGFLRGYAATPPGALLTAYEVDKAAYELLYETRNRPTWADIPLTAIRAAIS